MYLNKNHRLVYDQHNVILQFHETREREKKNGTRETYEFTEDKYYPNVKTALKSFVNSELKGLDTIDEVLKRVEQLETTINKLGTVNLN